MVMSPHRRRWLRRARLAAAMATFVVLAGCGTRPTATAPAVAVARPEGTTAFTLDPEASEIWLFLRADGPMSKVGHAHVISTHGLRGTLWLHAQAERSGCQFDLPVAAFVVDDPQERAAAGAEFAEPLDEAARAGTREHMLGDRQLNAAQFPEVLLRCQRVITGTDGIKVELSVTVRDHVATLSVPVSWQRSGNTLRASGEFSFRQTSVGLEPYSLLFGALRVSDEIRARFQLLARAT